MITHQPQVMLITGGAGFIGANFVRYILQNHPDIIIVNLDKLTYAGSLNNLKNLPNKDHHHFVQGDICDAHLVQHLLLHHHVDTIVHFAAESHVDRSIESPNAFVTTNVVGTFTLLEAARHYWFDIAKTNLTHYRFHHISTDEVYGSLKLEDPLFTEKTLYQPNSPYSATKAASDHLVRAYHHTYGLPVTLSHCTNNYGPYQHIEKFIPTIIQSCLNNKLIPIYGNGKNIRDWLYVEDHCRAIYLVLTQGRIGEAYNIGGNNEWENLALANYICTAMDTYLPRENSYHSLIEFVTDRPGHDFRYAIDTSKIKSELNWMPEETLETGLHKTFDFYLNNSVYHCSVTNCR